MQTREFTKHDWNAFAGAEAWQSANAEGTLPLLGAGRFENGKEFCLVLDCTGGCLVVEDDPQCEYGGYALELPFPTQAAARVFAQGLGEPRHTLDLLLVGFKPI